MAQYTLKTKVLNAENLMHEGHPATDTKTFVRLHVHEQNKFYGTECVENDANPNWNEELSVDVNDPAKDQLIVEVFNQTLNNNVPMCDPYMIPLDKLSLEGQTSAELDLDLQLNGQPVGKLNMHIELTTKEEHAEFKGPVLVRVDVTDAKGVTEVDEDADNEEDNDTYLLFLLKGHDEKETIKSIINKTSSNPAWNQSFSFISRDPQHDVILLSIVSGGTTVMDKETINLGETEPYTRSVQKYDFSKDEEETGGHLAIQIETIDLATFSNKPVNLHLKLIDAHNLLNLDIDKSDPYVKAAIAEKEVTTEVQMNTLDPVWNQEFDFVSMDPIHDDLTLQLLDKDITSDDTMMDPLVFPIRDIKTPQDGTTPLLYDVPLKLKGKKAGRLTFEILAKGECLLVQKGEIILDFTVLKADFKDSPPVLLQYGLKSNEEDPPIDIELNEKVSTRIPDPESEVLMLVFMKDDDDQDNLCDPVQIPLKDYGVNKEADYEKPVTLDDQETGNIHVRFYVKDPSQKVEEPPVEVKTRDVPLAPQDDYCDFLWGTYGSSYSTSFTGYSNCTPLSSTIDEAEIKYHHRHPVLEKDATKPKKRSETLSGKISSVELSSPNNAFVVGDKYYATATLYGKSSRNSSKFPPIQSDAVEAQDANKLSFNNLNLNFDSKLKKGDYIEVNLYHQSDNKQIAKSTIVLEKVDPADEEKSSSFPLNEYKLVKNPAQIGTLNADLKHTVQFQ